MMATRFSWYELRATEPAAARGFYAAVAGLEVRDVGGRALVWHGGRAIGEIGRLPEQAAARGAPQHWLPHVGVGAGALDAVAESWLAAGAEPLGPRRPTGDGEEVLVLRDPSGVVVALTSRAASEGPAAVAWHELHAADGPRALGAYAERFGWVALSAHAIGGAPATEVYRTFAWAAGGAAVGGALSSVKLFPGVHPHWLVYWPVADLDAAIARARAAGARKLLPVRELPGGARSVAGDDAQGGAFGLVERRG